MRMSESSESIIDQAGSRVTEFQGIYGPVTISERVVQWIWSRNEWKNSPVRLWSGETCRVCFPGEWNSLDGPDFRNARIEVAGRMLNGGVEIHFYAEDWERHGHHRNPSFDETVLHVCVFPPSRGGFITRTCSGRELPLLILGPLIGQDLESALDHLPGALPPGWLDMWGDWLVCNDEDTIRSSLRELARARFDQKVNFLRWLLQNQPVGQVMHEWLLGQLGIPRNRAAMVALAQCHSPEEVASAGFVVSDAVSKLGSAAWRRSGIRPQNLPERRLGQYRRMLINRFQWFDHWMEYPLASWQTSLAADRVSGFRRHNGLPDLRKWIQAHLFGDTWHAGRLDSIVVDVLLPARQALCPGEALHDHWFHWWSGNWPDNYAAALRKAPLGNPGNLNGWYQGLLGWILESGQVGGPNPHR